MKKSNNLLAIYLLLAITIISCNKNDDNELRTSTSNDFSSVEIQDFIWEGLNNYYLWKDNIPNLSNSKNDNETSYFNYLNSYTEPDEFFESLIYNRQTTDKWSWIVDDYITLENSFQGISTSNGIEYSLSYETDSDINVLGYVKYILPNSDAASKDVKRGYVFNSINNTQLTINNYKTLLAQETYTINFGELNNGVPILNGKNVELTKSEYQENPVYIAKTFDIAGKKIGYLMYNSFTSNYDQQMNAAFAQLITEGATELVLDLRYNGGGSVQTSVYLASMITGDFTGQLFAKERWNAEIQDWFEAYHPDWIENVFTNEIVKTDSNDSVILQENINSLHLSNLYVITSGGSASASELIINGLNPYINVVTIGTTTHGKYTGSITLYDSETFGRTGANLNQNHTWAMQPIVLETVNKLDENDKDGFEPTFELIDYVSQMQELGNENEPLLAKAIELITGVAARSSNLSKTPLTFKKFFDSKDLKTFGNDMYVEKKLPFELIKR